MLKEEKIQDLASVYTLLTRINSLTILRTTFLEYIKVKLSSVSLVVCRSNNY